MTAPVRWWLRVLAVSIVWAVTGLVFVAVGEIPAAIVAGGAAVTMAIQARAMVFVYRGGFYTGRGSVLADMARIRLGRAPSDPTAERYPWDPFPAWPDDDEPADSDPGHTVENGI